jgi:Domain of unknown function (DUF4124)
MRSPWTWFLIAVLAASAARAAVIWKWTDDKGVVHYSDQPVPGAEKIITSGRSNQGLTSGQAGTPAAAAKKPASASGATSLHIVSPTSEQTFFGDQPIVAQVSVDPAPKPSQTIHWSLNGQELASGPDPAVTLPHLDRGTYSVSATITDQDTGASQSSDAVTFYVSQPSLLSPEHHRP